MKKVTAKVSELLGCPSYIGTSENSGGLGREKKTQISPKNICSIFIKIGYAQLHMMVNNCVEFY
jgi:hypothetical protein